MPKEYETEYWRVRLPDEWFAREADGEARVEIRKSGGVGVLGVITTDDEPSVWDRRGEVFHGQLYGRTGEYRSEKFDLFSRWWTLWCGNVTLYVSYCCAASACEAERVEVEGIVYSLLPKSINQPIQPLFSS